MYIGFASGVSVLWRCCVLGGVLLVCGVRVWPLPPLGVLSVWGVFVVAFVFWGCFVVCFGFCLVLSGYCSATVLLEGCLCGLWGYGWLLGMREFFRGGWGGVFGMHLCPFWYAFVPLLV